MQAEGFNTSCVWLIICVTIKTNYENQPKPVYFAWRCYSGPTEGKAAPYSDKLNGYSTIRTAYKTFQLATNPVNIWHKLNLCRYKMCRLGYKLGQSYKLDRLPYTRTNRNTELLEAFLCFQILVLLIVRVKFIIDSCSEDFRPRSIGVLSY